MNIYQTMHKLVTASALDSTPFVFMAPYICEAEFSVIAVIKKQALLENQYETGNKNSGVESDSKGRELCLVSNRCTHVIGK